MADGGSGVRGRRKTAAGSVLAGLGGLGLALGALATPSSAADEITLPGSVVIETIDGHRTIDDLSPDAATALANLRTEQAASEQDVLDQRLPGGYAAAVTPTLSVVYLSPMPSSVQAVVDTAVADWVAVLDIQEPICVTFDWADLDAQGLYGVLGFASATGYAFEDSTGLFYPFALANQLAGWDFAEGCELSITLASNYHNVPGGLYASTNGDPVPDDQLDVYSIVLHELAHGLGFGGLVFENEDGPFLWNPPSVFDSLVLAGGAELIELADPTPWLTSNDLWIDIGGGLSHQLFAPSSFIGGSSYSHFDEDSYLAGSPGALMTPNLQRGESVRQLDGPVLGVMAQSGWPMLATAITPVLGQVSVTTSSATVQWVTPLTEPGLPPVGYRMEAEQGGIVVESTIVHSGSATSATVGNLRANQSYTISVVPVGVNGDGPATSTTVTTEAATDPGSSACGIDIPSNPTLGSEGGEFAVDVGDPGTAAVWRLYSAMFLRQPDRAGFDYWNQLHRSGVSLDAIAAEFVASPEMVLRYGSLDDGNFLGQVYVNTLSRCQDQAGFDYWMGLLERGDLSRGQMLMYFSSSAEFKIRTGVTS